MKARKGCTSKSPSEPPHTAETSNLPLIQSVAAGSNGKHRPRPRGAMGTAAYPCPKEGHVFNPDTTYGVRRPIMNADGVGSNMARSIAKI